MKFYENMSIYDTMESKRLTNETKLTLKSAPENMMVKWTTEELTFNTKDYLMHGKCYLATQRKF